MCEYQYSKYQTKNPLVLRLIDGFYCKVADILRGIEYDSLLDAGCGDGEALARLASHLPDNVLGIDNNEDQITQARRRLPNIGFEIQDIYNLPYKSNAFDVVLSLEVLEHMKYPSEAMEELVRVSSKYLILSVPYEPFFMLGNLIRGKNLLRFGNDLEHINHWTKRSFSKFVSAKAERKLLTGSFPWLMALCCKV
jgi:2-polyprenyl-3-methyl-5-hydroxy-6-metoxy-1,4-benzoquinol methylase